MLTAIREQIANTIFPEAVERRNALERAALTDELTGLANRRAFERAQGQAKRDRMAFILFDLNNFGKVNKFAGHAAGDELLKYYAAVVGRVAHKFKVRAFRIGGDEFAVICPPKFAYAVREAAEHRALAKQFDAGFTVSMTGEIGMTLTEADSRIQRRKVSRKSREAGK